MIAIGVIISYLECCIYAKGDFPIEYEQNMLIHAQDLSRFTLLIQQFFSLVQVNNRRNFER